MKSLLELIGIKARGRVIRQTILQDDDLTRVVDDGRIYLVREGNQYRIKEGTVNQIDFSLPVYLKYIGNAPSRKGLEDYVPFSKLKEGIKK